jgi:hypothetical protein
MSETVFIGKDARGSSSRRSHTRLIVAFAAALALAVACTTRSAPTAPTDVARSAPAAPAEGVTTMAHDHNSAADEDKGYIAGWFEGEEVQLYYTKSFFCREPPDSGAGEPGCEIGADAEIPPRDGPIPTIYAIAAVGGIQPDLSTLSCPPLSVCLNHPAMIDASRIGGSPTGPAVPHSHIVAERRAGWFHTVNIRVRDINAWNQIAEAKSLAKVRELQADPLVGGKGLISADTPTNIFFFIASWRTER